MGETDKDVNAQTLTLPGPAVLCAAENGWLTLCWHFDRISVRMKGVSMSFGRKGLAPGAVAAAAPRPVVPAQRIGETLTTRREASAAPFNAREGAAPDRTVTTPDQSSDPLAGLRNGVRPATRREETVGDTWSPMPEKEMRAAMQNRRGAGAGHGKRFVFGEPSKRSLALAYVFWFIAGQGSLHRFYCGQSQSALLQIGLLFGSVLFGLIFVPIAVAGIFLWFFWIVADLFLMPGMMRRFKAEYPPDYGGIFS